MNAEAFRQVKLKKVNKANKDNRLHQIIEGLYISSKDGALNEGELLDSKITHILNLAPEVASSAMEGIVYLTIKCVDTPDYPMDSHFEECTAFIELALQKGRCLVHCNAGISRSATIILAFLIVKHDMSLKDAYKIVKKSRKNIHPNNGFMKQLELIESSHS